MKVKATDKVRLACTISHNHNVLEEFNTNGPLEVQLGEQNLPIPIEMMIVGEEAGKAFSLAVAAKDNVYGAINTERIKAIPVSQFNQIPNVGELVDFKAPNGESIAGQVINRNSATVKVDFNHPYAGRDLLFQIKILNIL